MHIGSAEILGTEMDTGSWISLEHQDMLKPWNVCRVLPACYRTMEREGFCPCLSYMKMMQWNAKS